jgi:hypothetical protein
VSIVDTSAATLPDSLYTDAANPPRARWLAHNNTIFDMAWAKVGEGRRAPACLPVPPPSLSPPPHTHTHNEDMYMTFATHVFNTHTHT